MDDPLFSLEQTPRRGLVALDNHDVGARSLELVAKVCDRRSVTVDEHTVVDRRRLFRKAPLEAFLQCRDEIEGET